MNRREFLKSAGCLATAGAFAQNAQRKPNIILILSGDLGPGGLSCYGADNFRTPNLDRLASSGLRFTHSYSAPLAGPSRALFLTGRYAFRTGATNQDAAGRMDPSEETMLPAYLKSAGYVSACVGKWGQLPLTPAAFGFDEEFLSGGGPAYWTTLARTDYVPDRMHGFLASFLERHRAAPFFVYYALSHMHGDIQPTPDSAPDNRDLYADNILYMDKLVGKLLAELDRLKLRDDTLIVFTSDNGTGGVYAGESTIGGRRLAGEKGSLLEGGSLVPLIVNWPGKTPSGQVVPDLVDSTDFLPTFAALAGAPLPTDVDFDGVSLAPRILGQAGPKRDWIFVELGKNWYVRDASWKLTQSGELFDMRNAPFEEPLASGHNDARQRLQSVLDKLDPAGGITDDGDGNGRHKGRTIHTRKKKKPS
jgi:hypothetical protein